MAEAAAAKADNVSLAERLQYVNGYRSQVKGPNGAGGRRRGSHGGDVEAGSDVVQRYSKMYEETINPFQVRLWLACTRAPCLLTDVPRCQSCLVVAARTDDGDDDELMLALTTVVK